MAIITRVSRLLRADLHAVLDRLEEPDVLLRQAVREMEDALDEQRRLAARLRAELAELGQRATQFERTIAEIEEQLDVCFAAGNDGLARTLVRRKLETRQLAIETGERREHLGEDLAALEDRLAENQLRLESMRQKAEMFEPDASGDPRPCARGPVVGVSADDVEIAFLRERRDRVPS